MNATETSGRTVVGTVYVVVVLVAGLFGALAGVILPGQKNIDVAVLGPIRFEITPVSFALYGMVMVGLSLGVLLLLVRFASSLETE